MVGGDNIHPLYGLWNRQLGPPFFHFGGPGSGGGPGSVGVSGSGGGSGQNRKIWKCKNCRENNVFRCTHCFKCGVPQTDHKAKDCPLKNDDLNG